MSKSVNNKKRLLPPPLRLEAIPTTNFNEKNRSQLNDYDEAEENELNDEIANVTSTLRLSIKV